MKPVLIWGASLPTLPLLAVVSLIGCVTNEIVVATLEGGAPPPEHRGPPPEHFCDTNSDCHDKGLWCEKPRCEEFGHCVPHPVFCPMEAMPSCGCDGITYWTDCLRKQHGVSAAGTSECLGSAAMCSSSDAHECPMPGASCARLLPPGASCSGEIQGVCWMLPEVCPEPPSPETYTSCADAGICEDTCSAIRSGAVHQRSPQRGCP